MPRPRGTALMKCPRCQHENPPHAKFCLECEANLALTCAKCQGTLPTGAKFCLECGEPVVLRLRPHPTLLRRRHILLSISPGRFSPPRRLSKASTIFQASSPACSILSA